MEKKNKKDKVSTQNFKSKCYARKKTQGKYLIKEMERIDKIKMRQIASTTMAFTIIKFVKGKWKIRIKKEVESKF